MQPVTSSTPVVTSRVVNASNVIVKKQALFLTNDESAARVERIEIEIVPQKSHISVRRKGVDRGEAEASNDVFTLLEHPSVKGMKGETPCDEVNKEETIFEAHVRTVLVKTDPGTTSVFNKNMMMLYGDFNIFSLHIMQGLQKVVFTIPALTWASHIVSFFSVAVATFIPLTEVCPNNLKTSLEASAPPLFTPFFLTDNLLFLQNNLYVNPLDFYSALVIRYKQLLLLNYDIRGIHNMTCSHSYWYQGCTVLR